MDRGRGVAKRETKDPPAVVVFVASYVLLATGRLIFRADPGWWDGLRKPSWLMPSTAEAVGWFLMYGVLASSAVLTIRNGSGTKEGTRIFVLRVTHLLLLQLSVYLLFGAHLLGPAAVAACVLAAVAVATTVAAMPVSRLASVLFGVYSLWLLYNASGVVSLWLLNR